MSLLASELEEIKYHLGYNALAVGADAYVGIVAMFEQVVAPYLLSGLITSSATAVASASSPTQRTLVLAAASGTNTQGTAVSVHVGDALVVDVDYAQEIAIVQSISGVNVTLLLSNAHAGTYPVTVQGGEAIVRKCLRECRRELQQISSSSGRAGIKKVDEIEFFQSKTLGGSTVLGDLSQALTFWRKQLWRVLFGEGDFSLAFGGGGGGGTMAVY